MKSTEIKKEDIKRGPTQFPVLKQWKGDGAPFVVLFTSEKRGTVVCQNGVNYKLGYTSDWVPCKDEEWVDFEGQIVLEN